MRKGARAIIKIFFALISYGSTCYGSNNNDLIQDSINDVFEYAQNSIHHVENDKIFFKPEKVCCFEGKIYVQGEHGEVFPIPHLFSEDNGLFLYANSEMYPIWICKKCTKSHSYEPRTCERCGHTEFRVRYLYK